MNFHTGLYSDQASGLVKNNKVVNQIKITWKYLFSLIQYFTFNSVYYLPALCNYLWNIQAISERINFKTSEIMNIYLALTI